MAPENKNFEDQLPHFSYAPLVKFALRVAGRIKEARNQAEQRREVERIADGHDWMSSTGHEPAPVRVVESRRR